ncbi:MAG: putative ABC transporter ATP-binding protein YxlF [Microgenomates bacterium OLB23]|nr:MAG: putative ABC transporter ATP-binding protein YxlF [Microgenomates bacterium OLB23]
MITVSHLRKTYRTPTKEEGAAGMIKNIFARKYKDIEAVQDISFEIQQGELVGFVGPNGAGKTTTMKMLAGILYPTSGELSVLGYTPFEKNHHYLKQISFIMGQKNQMLWELPASDTFKLNKTIYEVPDDEYVQTLGELTEMLDAKDVIDQPVKTLSLGQRMKVELISTLIHKPKVLFLDEPTIGLDVVAQKNIRDFIQQYQSHYKATILLTSHYMEDVRRLANRVIIIDHGALLYDGDIEKLIKKYARTKSVEIVVDDMPNTVTLEKNWFSRVNRLSKNPLSCATKKMFQSLLQQSLNTFPLSTLQLKKKKLKTLFAQFSKKSSVKV